LSFSAFWNQVLMSPHLMRRHARANVRLYGCDGRPNGA
jgi:hypothetical protein